MAHTLMKVTISVAETPPSRGAEDEKVEFRQRFCEREVRE